MKNLKFIIPICFLILILAVIFFNYKKNNIATNYSLNELICANTITEEETYIIVHMTGAVNSPGLVTLAEGARISDAIESAGGLSLEADLSKINLAYQLSDGQKIYIPSIHDIENIVYITDSAGNNIIVDSITNTLININTATQTELETLTGIGPSLANTIITHRKENGKFKSIEELKNVPGIGESKFNSIKDFICIK